MSRLKAWLEIVDKALLRLAIVAFITLAFLQIFTRYVTEEPLQWTEEVAVFVLMWMTYVGAWILIRSDSHVRLELIEVLFPAPVVRAINILWQLVILATLIIVIYAGIELVPQLSYDKTPALQISYSYVFAIIPISAFIMALYSIGRIYDLTLGRR